MAASPYCSERDLEKIRLEAQAAEVPIEEGMKLWVPAEARAFFMSKGMDRPDPAILARRSPDDKVDKRPCCGKNEQEVCLCVFCCCGMGCDQMTMALIESCRKKKGGRGSKLPEEPGAVDMQMMTR